MSVVSRRALLGACFSSFFFNDTATTEIYTLSLHDALPIYHRGSTVNSLTLRLIDANEFEAFKAGIESDPRLKVSVQTTRQYYSRQSESIAQIVGLVGTTIGAIIALGGVFGAQRHCPAEDGP